MKTAVRHLLNVGEELLPIAAVDFECPGLFLRVEPSCFAHSRHVKAAQCRVPWPGQHAIETVEAPAVFFGERVHPSSQHEKQLGLALGRS